VNEHAETGSPFTALVKYGTGRNRNSIVVGRWWNGFEAAVSSRCGRFNGPVVIAFAVRDDQVGHKLSELEQLL